MRCVHCSRRKCRIDVYLKIRMKYCATHTGVLPSSSGARHVKSKFHHHLSALLAQHIAINEQEFAAPVISVHLTVTLIPTNCVQINDRKACMYCQEQSVVSTTRTARTY